MAYKSKYTGEQIEELLGKIENFDPEQGGGGGDVTPVPLYAEVTYEELKALRDNKQLEAGMKYRITDFVTETKQTNTRSAKHPFDVIVTALDAATLSEEAMAIPHEGDTYFRYANLASWKIWYSLDNNSSKYSWVQKNDIPQKWSTQWGVLEEKYDDADSENYDIVTVDGVEKYIYRPSSPNNYLEGKTLYKRVLVGQVTDPNDLIYESDSAPWEEEEDSWWWEDMGDITVYTASGDYITTLRNEYGTFYDVRDNDYRCGIYFDPNAEEVDMDVYHFTPTSGIEDWWYEFQGGIANVYDNIPYEGSTDSFYYAFDSKLPKANIDVEEAYFDGSIYVCSDDIIDTVTYSPYQGFKGVIYRMIDEYGNDLPYDFKNIQFYWNGSWSYTFGRVNEASISSSAGTQCFGNVVSHNSKTLLPLVCWGNVTQNRIKGEYTEIYFSGSATYNDLVFTAASKLNAKANFDGNQLAIDRDITTNGVFSKNRAVYMYTPLVTTGTIYACQFDVNSRSSTPLTINVGRMNDCIVNGCGTFSIKSTSGSTTGYLFSSTINLGVGGSNVTLKTSKTTSMSNRIEGVFLNAFNWGTSEKSIDISDFSLNSACPLHIALSRGGVVVMWNDADIPNRVSSNSQSISENLSSIENIESSIENIESRIENIEEKINEYHPEE